MEHWKRALDKHTHSESILRPRLGGIRVVLASLWSDHLIFIGWGMRVKIILQEKKSQCTLCKNVIKKTGLRSRRKKSSLHRYIDIKWSVPKYGAGAPRIPQNLGKCLIWPIHRKYSDTIYVEWIFFCYKCLDGLFPIAGCLVRIYMIEIWVANANSQVLGQTPRSAASGLGLHCLLNFEQVFFTTCKFKNHWMSSKQCRPWSDAALCGVWSGSTLFCQPCQMRLLCSARKESCANL